MRVATILGLFVVPFFALFLVESFPMAHELAVLISFGAGAFTGTVAVDTFRNLSI
jgi:hypothetical protein